MDLVDLLERPEGKTLEFKRDLSALGAEALLQRIDVATGKRIPREPEHFLAGIVAEVHDEGPVHWDAEEPFEKASS